jgi:hypothetical protein
MNPNTDIEVLKEKHDVIALDRIMMRGSAKKAQEAAIALVELDDPSVEDDVCHYAMKDLDHHNTPKFIAVLAKSSNPVYLELMDTMLNRAYRDTHKTR